MVVRLGQTSDVGIVNSQRYRIRQGMALQLQNVSSEQVTVRAWARVRYDNGEDDTLFIADESLPNDRSIALTRPSDVARLDGWVTDALVELPLDATIKRGQVYIRLFMDPFGPLLCKDYVYSNFGQVALGTYIQDGPGGGAGNLEIVTLKAESVPAASTSHTFAVSNEIRRILGFAWYYASSADVASRALNVDLRTPLGAVPTGFVQSDQTWNAETLTLTASQDGASFADEKRSSINDNDSLSIQSSAANPSPFPIWATEGDTYTIVFQVASLHANDLDVIYLLRESWVMEL